MLLILFQPIRKHKSTGEYCASGGHDYNKVGLILGSKPWFRQGDTLEEKICEKVRGFWNLWIMLRVTEKS